MSEKTESDLEKLLEKHFRVMGLLRDLHLTARDLENMVSSFARNGYCDYYPEGTEEDLRRVIITTECGKGGYKMPNEVSAFESGVHLARSIFDKHMKDAKVEIHTQEQEFKRSDKNAGQSDD
jgi:hypothetical protein